MRVGNTYGSVFELLHAKSFNDWVIEYEDCPEKLDELIQLYVSCLKQVHETELDKSDLPFARDEMLEKVAALQAYLPQDFGTLFSCSSKAAGNAHKTYTGAFAGDVRGHNFFGNIVDRINILPLAKRDSGVIMTLFGGKEFDVNA